jgi:hypothetical protein
MKVFSLTEHVSLYTKESDEYDECSRVSPTESTVYLIFRYLTNVGNTLGTPLPDRFSAAVVEY